ETRPVRLAPADPAAVAAGRLVNGEDVVDRDLRHADTLAVEQVQGRRGWREGFHLPVTVTWSRGGLEHSRRVDIVDRRQDVALDGQGDLDWVRFDGTTVVPGTIREQQGEAMWASQLRGASDGVTRLVAAQWFARGRGRPGRGSRGGA